MIFGIKIGQKAQTKKEVKNDEVVKMNQLFNQVDDLTTQLLNQNQQLINQYQTMMVR